MDIFSSTRKHSVLAAGDQRCRATLANVDSEIRNEGLERETGIEPATLYLEARVVEILAQSIAPGNFRPKSRRFEHLTQVVLSIC